MAQAKHVTSRDVAALAGVSQATVSYVMNGRADRRIPPDTQERVRAAARTLGYSPNRVARSLRQQRTEQVCLLVGSIGVPVYDQLARELHAVADEVGYGVTTLVVDSAARAERAVELLQQRITDGAIIAAEMHHLPNDALRDLARTLPLVVRSNTAAPDGFDVVREPEGEACREAFEYLFRTGRRRVAFLGHPYELSQTIRATHGPSERLAAYLAAIDKHGGSSADRLVVPGAEDRVAAYHTVSQLLAQPDPPDAIFAASDRSGISALWAARDAGLTIPDDIAIIGSGNLPEDLITRPTLSSVGPVEHDYTIMVRMLFERVLADSSFDGREVVIPWNFIQRGSA